MKDHLVKPVITCITLLLSISLSASTSDTTTLVSASPNTTTNQQSPTYKEGTSPLGHRSLSSYLCCTISDTDGVSITTVDTEDIYLYEIYDNSSCCIATFSNDYDFVSYLFSLSGDYLIQFTTADNIYSGYIQL
jgi:uncharacterized protein YozE (UPF0346 family)